jgi:hypothetical protein
VRVASALFAACLVTTACGRAPTEGPTAERSGGSCLGALVVDGAWYQLDRPNEDRLDADDLGPGIGEVGRVLPCEGTATGDTSDGIWAVGVPVGSEVREVPGVSPAAMLAVDADDGVQVFRAVGADPLATVDGDVEAIGINSAHDATIRFATIDDDRLIGELLAELADAPPAPTTIAPVAGGDADDVDDEHEDPDDFLVSFERGDGLVTLVPFWPATDRLGDRTVGAVWAGAVADALADAPDPDESGDLRLTGVSGTAAFYAMGACRHDRPKLDVVPGEELQASHDPAVDVRWWLHPPQPSDGTTEPVTRAGSTLIVPDFTGTMIVEAILVDGDGVEIADLCTTLRSVPADRSSGG